MMPHPSQATAATILPLSILLTFLFFNNASAIVQMEVPKVTYIATPQVTARDFLVAHNDARAQYNMPLLSWDDELADYARKHAEKTNALGKCQDMYHSHGPYGENLFWGWCQNDCHTPRYAVMRWFNESQWFDVKSLMCEPGKMCGHFTQVIWRNTKRVGCARIKCTTQKGGILISCNYDPPGNWEDAKLGGRMNPFAFDKSNNPQQPQIPVLPVKPQPVMLQPAHPIGNPAPVLPQPQPSGGFMPKKEFGAAMKVGQRIGGHHHRGRNSNRNPHNHLGPRQRLMNRIRRRRQNANRKI